MATGYLLFPPGYHPLISGAIVPSGKLHFYRTATTTDQDTYTDADLSVANANPVILNATGGLDTHVYLDPTTGFRYRCRIYSAADVLLDTFDDLLGFGANVATYAAEGSFTASITGCTTAVTGTVSYRIFANSAGTGKKCTLRAAATISGTSNTTAMTMTGLPAACQPTVGAWVLTPVLDNSTSLLAAASIAAAASTITFYIDQPFSTIGFTGGNSKGVEAGWQITYDL